MARQRAATHRAEEPAGYGELLEDLKTRIRTAQVRAALAVNRELIALYWEIGGAIVERQQRNLWGSSVIERLSRDLCAAFPDAQGFSPRNLWRMRALYLAYTDPSFLPQPVAEMVDTASAEAKSPPILPSATADTPPSATATSILPQAVAELMDTANTDSSPILPQPATEIGAPPTIRRGSPILPQAVAEMVDSAFTDAVGSPILPQGTADTGVEETMPSILPQAVAEMVDTAFADAVGSPILPQAPAGTGVAETMPSILPQAVAEMVDSAITDAGLTLPHPVAEFTDSEPDGVVNALLPRFVAELPWSHNIVLLEKLRSADERLWYARMAARHGWSRNVLVHQIETRLHTRTGRAVTNFEQTLPAAESDLIRELLKDPYHFGFLQLAPNAQERDLERALLSNVRDFLLELGVGFSLVGSQFHLEVGGQDYFLDLLFFHIRLRRYVVVELKIGAFQPEDAGKMHFYLSAIDDLYRHEENEPSIGLILCKERNRVVAEYALRGTTRPIGVAQYRLMDTLPAQLRENLPTVEELEKRLERGAARR